jgi:hypothetical protein
VADIAHHDERTVRRACAILAREGDAVERADARELLCLLDTRAREVAVIGPAPRNAALVPERTRSGTEPDDPLVRRCADCFQLIAPDGSGHTSTCVYEGQPEAFPRCGAGG